jgi:hypothetical protein
MRTKLGRDLDGLRGVDVVAILDTIEWHVTFAPGRETRSRIKRHRGATACG